VVFTGQRNTKKAPGYRESTQRELWGRKDKSLLSISYKPEIRMYVVGAVNQYQILSTVYLILYT